MRFYRGKVFFAAGTVCFAALSYVYAATASKAPIGKTAETSNTLDAVPATSITPLELKAGAIRASTLEALENERFQAQLARLLGAYHRSHDGLSLIRKLKQEAAATPIFFDPTLPPQVRGQYVRERDPNSDFGFLPPKVIFNGRPEVAKAPIALLASGFLHEMIHAIGLGEYAAHRVQLLYYDGWRGRAKNSEDVPPANAVTSGLVEEELQDLSDAKRQGRLIPLIKQRYGKKFPKYPEDRLVSIKWDLRHSEHNENTASFLSRLKRRFLIWRLAWLKWRLGNPLPLHH